LLIFSARLVAQSHTPCNRCVRFATTVASGHATLATKRTLLLTWAGLSPAGSHQLCLAHSFDHLIGESEQLCWHFEPERLCGLEIHHKLEPGRLFHRKLGRLCAFEDSVDVARSSTKKILEVGTIRHESLTWAGLAPADWADLLKLDPLLKPLDEATLKSASDKYNADPKRS
jgi:hypothetical protein